MKGHEGGVCLPALSCAWAEERPWETQREGSPCESGTVLTRTASASTSSLQNYRKIDFHSWSHPTCGISLWQTEMIYNIRLVNDYKKETWNVKKEGKIRDLANAWVNTIDYFSPVKIFKIWMMGESKHWTLSDGVFNAHRGKTYGNLNIKKGAWKDLRGDEVSTLHLKWSKNVRSIYNTQSNHLKISYNEIQSDTQ